MFNVYPHACIPLYLPLSGRSRRRSHRLCHRRHRIQRIHFTRDFSRALLCGGRDRNVCILNADTFISQSSHVLGPHICTRTAPTRRPTPLRGRWTTAMNALTPCTATATRHTHARTLIFIYTTYYAWWWSEIQTCIQPIIRSSRTAPHREDAAALGIPPL